jgi:prophage antirepressor-like protein
MEPSMETSLALSPKQNIRKTFHDNEWWFVLDDLVPALTDSKDHDEYIQLF